MTKPHRLYSIEDFDLRDKKVFVRTDFNVPVYGSKTKDHIRLQSALPTLKHVLENRGKLIVASHRGRPGQSREPTGKSRQPTSQWQDRQSLSLEPFGPWLSQQLNCEVIFIKDLTKAPSIVLSSLNEKKIILLENLRFYPEEEKGDEAWALALARSLDIYINEAFSVSHRNHTSMTLLPQRVKKRGMGFSLKKEIETLDFLKEKSPSPFALLAGGAKVGDKIKTLTRLSDRVDVFLIGGLMAYTFLKTQGRETGSALIQRESLKSVADFMERLRMRGKKLFLPVDHVVVPAELALNQTGTEQADPAPRVLPFEKGATGEVFPSWKGGAGKVTEGPDVPKGFIPLDIGPKTVQHFSLALKEARSVFWNGPMGKFEDPLFAKGTLAMGQAVADCDEAFRAVGGGDSLSAVSSLKNQEDFDYISTGGGAGLQYLAEGRLTGLQSLLMRASPATSL